MHTWYVRLHHGCIPRGRLEKLSAPIYSPHQPGKPITGFRVATVCGKPDA